MSTQELVVTGYGCVSSLGDSAARTYAGWASGACAIREVRGFDTSALGVHLGAEVEGVADVVDPRGAPCRGRSMLARALGEALAMAAPPPGVRPLVLCGTTKGFLGAGRQVGEHEAHDFRTPARWLERELRARLDARPGRDGATNSWTISVACASGTATLAAALGKREALVVGTHDVIVCAAVDQLSDFVYRGFAALGAVDAEPCRPFDRTRAGMSPSEGAAVIVLETVESARRRGIAPIGHVLGAGAGCDAAHPTAPARDAGGMRRAIRVALDVAGTPASRLGHVHAHGTATLFNDEMELRALTLALAPATDVPLTTLKGNAGHAFGAAGLIEFISSLEAVRRGVLPAIRGLRDPEECWPLVTEPLSLDSSRFLKLSAGFGGLNVAVVGEGVPS